MVARVWRGRTRSGEAAEYLEYVLRTGVVGQRATPGNLGSLVLTRPEGGETEFVVLSLWESMDSVRRFAGDEPERAVYYPEDRRYLLQLDPGVAHYSMAASELGTGGAGRRPAGAIGRGAWVDGAWAPASLPAPNGGARTGR